jgi:hypothetical protein
MKKALVKQLGGGDDAVIDDIIDEETAKIEMYVIKKVVRRSR